jgi:hypothetical protein
MLAFNSGLALVDTASYNIQEGFSETIVNIVVNTSGKAGAHILHPPWEMIHLPREIAQ